jgi:hypothetical protein
MNSNATVLDDKAKEGRRMLKIIDLDKLALMLDASMSFYIKLLDYKF